MTLLSALQELTREKVYAQVSEIKANPENLAFESDELLLLVVEQENLIKGLSRFRMHYAAGAIKNEESLSVAAECEQRAKLATVLQQCANFSEASSSTPYLALLTEPDDLKAC